MGLTFGIIGTPTEKSQRSPNSAIVINKTLTNGAKAVVYELDNLLSPRPGESQAYGLNHKIIERLDTIKQVDVVTSTKPVITIPTQSQPKEILQTVDGGITYTEYKIPDSASYKNIGAGPKLRLDIMNAYMSKIILAHAVDASRIEDLITRYEKYISENNYPFVSKLSTFLVENDEKKACVRTLEDCWRDYSSGKNITGPIEKEAKLWIMMTGYGIAAKVERIVRRLRVKNKSSIEQALSDKTFEDTIPNIPFKLFAKIELTA